MITNSAPHSTAAQTSNTIPHLSTFRARRHCASIARPAKIPRRRGSRLRAAEDAPEREPGTPYSELPSGPSSSHSASTPLARSPPPPNSVGSTMRFTCTLSPPPPVPFFPRLPFFLPPGRPCTGNTMSPPGPCAYGRSFFALRAPQQQG